MIEQSEKSICTTKRLSLSEKGKQEMFLLMDGCCY